MSAVIPVSAVTQMGTWGHWSDYYSLRAWTLRNTLVSRDKLPQIIFIIIIIIITIIIIMMISCCSRSSNNIIVIIIWGSLSLLTSVFRRVQARNE